MIIGRNRAERKPTDKELIVTLKQCAANDCANCAYIRTNGCITVLKEDAAERLKELTKNVDHMQIQ